MAAGPGKEAEPFATSTGGTIATPYVRQARDETPLPGAAAPFSLRSLLGGWWRESLWPGMGLFGESYLLFSIGTLSPLWRELYPVCFGENEQEDGGDDDERAYGYASERSCSPLLLGSLAYGVVAGVVVGMVLLGCLSDRIGRRRGSIATAGLMAVGSLGLVGVSALARSAEGTGPRPEGLFAGTALALAVFGVGVGGEYPLSASLASENAAAEAKAGLGGTCGRRGRRVQLVFAMQGLGIWCNSLVMLGLFRILGRSNGNEDDDDDDDDDGSFGYDARDLLTIWRVTYGIGASVLCFVLLTRILYLEESKVWLEAQKTNRHNNPDNGTNNNSITINNKNGSNYVTNRDAPPIDPCVDLNRTQNNNNNNNAFDAHWRSIVLVHQQYGSRMFGAGASWFLWDVSFYGNKLFQSTILEALVGKDAGVVGITEAALLNASVALAGYFCAALVIDRVERKRLQSAGFLGTGALFVACGRLVSALDDRGRSFSVVVVVLYLLSSFVGQVGPNCTTFLVPAEIVPTAQRTYCHGVCAAAGKAGALVASVLFHALGSRGAGASLFYVSGAASLLAALVTQGFVPETHGLDLLDLDRRWSRLLRERGNERREGTGRPPGPDETSDCDLECEPGWSGGDGPSVRDAHTSPYERYRARGAAGAGFPLRGTATGWFS
ncbi:unnamed protein product [Pseudo-nitzschia multistriata]|uniref:Major facilitator superfamily (MFS) profile domain-containing protein n=1 Tax=Pseudo-nitzschia multistriata TaxID=183589 RepID=A0A448ZA99_9STRA|nr:unnamed protein product [Pseudo-nitzschia multistriata]